MGDESSRIERHDVVADALDLFEEVTREEDIDAVLGADLTDQGQHFVALDGIETVGRFVEQHERRIGGDRLGELHPLALTGRHGAERPKRSSPSPTSHSASLARPRASLFGMPRTSARCFTKSEAGMSSGSTLRSGP